MIKVLIALYPLLTIAVAVHLRSMMLEVAKGEPTLFWGWKPRILYALGGLLWPLVLVAAGTFAVYFKVTQALVNRGGRRG